MLYSGKGRKTAVLQSSSLGQDLRPLVVFFCLWKFVILSIIALAPGPGYDTSTTLLLELKEDGQFLGSVRDVATSLPVALKFVRWDAIYFSQIARRGYVLEQEYAFGSGYPKVLALSLRGIYVLVAAR
jgi:GPI mannosyltransferase 2